MTILDKIIENKRVEIEELKTQISIEHLIQESGFRHTTISLRNSLASSNTGIIAEFKRKSPSKGYINESAQVSDIIPGYADFGASGISILQDNTFFAGGSTDLIAARPLVNVPLLYKEFIIDEYQIIMAKAYGADAILLIAAVLTVEQCATLAQKAHQLGLETLLELHDPSEINHINNDIDMVGINNRNLKTFEVDIEASIRLCHSIPNEFLKISESGISQPETVVKLRNEGFQGFLMGENFMKTENPPLALKKFIEDIKILQ